MKHFNISKMMFFCGVSERSRGIISFFNLYRVNFRENVSFAKYAGLRRASW